MMVRNGERIQFGRVCTDTAAEVAIRRAQTTHGYHLDKRCTPSSGKPLPQLSTDHGKKRRRTSKKGDEVERRAAKRMVVVSRRSA